ncbi:MAG: hypothetical protein WBW33_29090 [Bryobacteraceae bacterium]
MTVFGFVLRLYSYLFNLILCLFLLGVGLIANASHTVPKLGMLPFTDENMNRGVITLAIVGLVCTLLAATGIFRYLFPVWTAVVLFLMVKGFIFSHYTFANETAFKVALWLTFGALVAFVGGLWVLKRRRF